MPDGGSIPQAAKSKVSSTLLDTLDGPPVVSKALPLPTQDSVSGAISNMPPEIQGKIREFLLQNPDATINRISQYVKQLQDELSAAMRENKASNPKYNRGY